jgi:glucokinase
MALFSGMDVGGTNLRVGVIDGLRLIYEKRFHANFSNICKSHPPDIAWQQIIQITSGALLEVFQAYPQITSVGIGFPGFIDPANGRIAQSPNLPGLLNADLAGDLSTQIGRPVVVENDALAAAYGEYRLNENNLRNLIYIGLGTGVGGGLIYADQPFTGQHGVAMEVGHMIVGRADGEDSARLCGCGNHGCLEQYASATGVTTSYKLATGLDFEASRIAELAQAGDKAALDAYSLAGACLAQAVAHIVKVVDVGHIVIGGGMSRAWPLMQSAFNQRLHTDLIPVLRDKVNIRISTSGDQAGIIGAALLSNII